MSEALNELMKNMTANVKIARERKLSYKTAQPDELQRGDLLANALFQASEDLRAQIEPDIVAAEKLAAQQQTENTDASTAQDAVDDTVSAQQADTDMSDERPTSDAPKTAAPTFAQLWSSPLFRAGFEQELEDDPRWKTAALKIIAFNTNRR